MPLTRFHLVTAAFTLAAGASFLAASYSVTAIEETSEIEIRNAFDLNDLPWAEVEADGLRVMIAGTAPTEAARFQALSLAGTLVDAERLIDEMDVAAVAALAPPRFSAEVLRNTSGISIIGLIPTARDRDEIVDNLPDLSGVPVGAARRDGRGEASKMAGWSSGEG